LPVDGKAGGVADHGINLTLRTKSGLLVVCPLLNSAVWKLSQTMKTSAGGAGFQLFAVFAAVFVGCNIFGVVLAED
jgi:hypothetical protein